jgi:hypothetical protein
MNSLQEATEKICDLKGSVLALECITTALFQALSPAQRATVPDLLVLEIESCGTMLLGAAVSESTVAAFERDSQRALTSLKAG